MANTPTTDQFPDATKMVLSPAAQAVLTEITQQGYGLDPADIPLEACHMAYIAAAALCAAADQGKLGPDHWEGSQPDERETGWNDAMKWLEAVAAELLESAS